MGVECFDQTNLHMCQVSFLRRLSDDYRTFDW